MSEPELIGHINTVFADFDKSVQRLLHIPQSAKKKTEKLLDLFNKDIFDDSNGLKFEVALAELSEEFGHGYETVLEIELKREGVLKSMADKNEIPVPAPVSGSEVKPSQIIQVGEQASGKPGITGYLSTRRWASVYEKYLKMKKDQATKMIPDISTAKEVVDILDFMRQMQPELHRTLDYYRKAKEHLSFFEDNDTKERFKTELRVHLIKICSIVRTFTRTSCEYRIEGVGDRKLAMARAIIWLQLSQYQAMGGLTTSDFYKALQEVAGPQNAGKS